ncbi:MAG: bifunctional tRNA (5-methylaminomethyl-2-thiouridine)(34)-methyltransferase MnmD/FAD-dependent 5-carboxymethylaminomethyl-2-thiouridine(34) oxidoreductase MnmC [Hyphomonadaceae bacterium]|nr:bifunctional tRNA (5-methylaminomethyl-2-thiouridine)(34)-methyltransferase MnmD/FAD-dependent 5-carboxymethylaminomethyl-2-thiouridine(34) oxidoreductase MnmC [Hyphomonadaceae bacterium]
MPRLPPEPVLTWSDDGTPSAVAFGDVYYSHTGGLAEAEAVFLAGCGLPGGWAGRDRFTVCEVGFGTGLNVLALWAAWKKTRLVHAQLHISTIEAFPLAVSDAARALATFPEISELAAQLLARWPVRAAAPQRLWFPDDGLSLTVHTGVAASVLPQLEGRFDAWFLDGFAPARNPEMWSPDLMLEIARLSAPGARLATFTVAGEVRRGLEAAGFAVEKRPGFGRKRERLEARYDGGPPTPSARLFPYAAPHPRRVAIVGAGIAGAACAQAFLRRGVETVVLDAARAPASGASGNPAGLVMPRLDRGGTLKSFYLAAYLYAVAAYEAFGVLDRCGVEQRSDPRGAEALADLLADPPLPPDWFAPSEAGHALHQRAGLVRPRAAIDAMLHGAQLITETEIRTLTPSSEGWMLVAPDGRGLLRADAVMLACGAALTAFEPARFLPIALSRGQIEWGEGAAPPHAVTRGNYLAAFDGGVLFGATFDPHADAATAAQHFEPDADARARNLAALGALAPDVAASVKVDSLRSRAALRATTPDRAPIAGLLPDAERWLEQYAPLAQGQRPPSALAPPAHHGIYVLGGLGARGLTTAPLLGEVIAGEMCGEPEMFSRAVRDALHPARFLLRALKRG